MTLAEEATSKTSCAGLVAERDGERTFVPNAAVRALVRFPKIEPLPRAPAGVLGYALALGEVMLVIGVGTARRDLVVCDWFGEALGIAGLVPIRTGSFLEADGGVMFEGQFIKTFDLNEVGQLLVRSGDEP